MSDGECRAVINPLCRGDNAERNKDLLAFYDGDEMWERSVKFFVVLGITGIKPERNRNLKSTKY